MLDYALDGGVVVAISDECNILAIAILGCIARSRGIVRLCGVAQEIKDS